ncbi:MPN domain-containing protein [Aplysia californica]|uniref:MPN domain-containing protein n=1 Tax=Aplysia californica TaxID=6500 RepID=A0ABM0JPE3_APLCA|nr:MPN domain-containing protein [Aplysia californica]
MASPEIESMEMKEEDVEMEEEDGEEMEMRLDGEEEGALHKAKQAITCRSVTLNTLMEDGVIHPGKGVLSIDYLGQRFEADLLESGKIKWQGSEEEFGTPSAWALHCKRLVNPIKRSGCGWASVKYNNKKLDIWKSIWARKHRVSSPFKASSDSSNSSPTKPPQPSTSPAMLASPTLSIDGEKCSPQTTKAPQDSPVSVTINDKAPMSACVKSSEGNDDKDKEKQDSTVHKEKKDTEKPLMSSLQQILVAEPAKVPPSGKSKAAAPTEVTPLNLSRISPSDKTTGVLQLEKSSHISQKVIRSRESVPYSSLGTRRIDIDPHTLVQCEKFDSHSKLQPFTVSVNSNALLLMDFHCYLTKSEVVGYLGGRWDTHKQHLSVEQVFPACCRLGDLERAPLVEEEIRRSMRSKHMTLVGWYHSHPYCQSDPSVHDVDCQMSYQLKMRGSGSMYQPCLAFIVSPFEYTPGTLDSQIQAFWVMPNLEHPAAYNIPMLVSFSIQRDSSLTEDMLSDMKHLSEYYSGAQDKLILREQWKEAITFVEKIRASIRGKLPEDQLDSGTFLDYMQQLLRDMK